MRNSQRATCKAKFARIAACNSWESGFDVYCKHKEAKNKCDDYSLLYLLFIFDIALSTTSFFLTIFDLIDCCGIRIGFG